MKILISGASITGLSAAYWLARHGHDVTVVERADGLRRGGSAIDVRGDALAVAREMGVLDEIRARSVRQERLTFLDRSGEAAASLDPSIFNESPDDVEIPRDALTDVLFAAVDESVRFRFECSVTALENRDEGASVIIDDGEDEFYDLVVGADGLHSTIRRLAFGPEEAYVRHLGLYIGLIELPAAEPSGTSEMTMFNAPEYSAAHAKYGRRELAVFVIRASQLEYDYHDVEAQKSLLAAHLGRDRSWRIPEFLGAMDARPEYFYFDAVSQVHMPTWSKGRVVLLGDAAHCAAFLSGMGTTLAMLGARYLAEELDIASVDPTAAFARVETRLRPAVARAQASVAENMEWMMPATWPDIIARNDRMRQLAAELAR